MDEMNSSLSTVTAGAMATINSTSEEAKSSVSLLCSTAVDALSASSKEMQIVIDKQSSELSSVTSVVDEFKVVTKQAESYAERLLKSSSSKESDGSSWFTMVNGKARVIESNQHSLVGAAPEMTRRRI